MIFVTVGSRLPFDRLVEAVDLWCARAPDQHVFGQIGALAPDGYRPRHFEWVETMTPQDYASACDRAGFLVAHAGIGSILAALTRGKPIVIMPRRPALGDTNRKNDHQHATARRMGDRPGVTVAEDAAALHAALDLRCAAESAPVVERLPDAADPGFTDRLRRFVLEGRLPEDAR